jgi:hypothetical protein
MFTAKQGGSIAILLAALAITLSAGGPTMADEPAVTPYGQKNPKAPSQLELFSFLVGKWHGTGRARLQDETDVDVELTWIGRYILNGTAIADEMHAVTPDGKPHLGISLRHFDASHHSWIIEFLNVTGSFIRRQVNPDSGSVSHAGDAIVIVGKDADTLIREHYRPSQDHKKFTYSMDSSKDGGRTWSPVSVEMTMTRID